MKMGKKTETFFFFNFILLPILIEDKSFSLPLLTVFASLQFCGISLRDYFYHPSVHSCIYPLMLDKVIPFPLSGLIPEIAALFWHSATILLFKKHFQQPPYSKQQYTWLEMMQLCLS